MKEVIMKDDKAVSPIIATILLVAITVVLAATLYTILGGYTTFLGQSTPQASIQLNSVSSGNSPVYMLYVKQFGGNISLNEVQLVITNSNNTPYYTTLGSDFSNPGTSLSGIWNLTVYGTSYLSASTVVKIVGDSASPQPTGISQVQLVDMNSNGVIATFSFSTSPLS